ncbi:hypothetical protein pb186bvf_004156 [Paramecium bursaria]
MEEYSELNPEEQRYYLRRKLRYKLPVVLRWGGMLGLFVGIYYAGLRQNNFLLFKYPLVGVGIAVTSLCYHDAYLYLSTYI